MAVENPFQPPAKVRVRGISTLQMEVAIEFKLPIRVRKKGKWFISSCPALDVFSQGRTRAEAEQNLIDALYSFLISCYEAETLEKVCTKLASLAVP